MLTDTEKRAFESIKRRIAKCPPWCFCNTKTKTIANAGSDKRIESYRFFSMCPLIPLLCPPGHMPKQNPMTYHAFVLSTVRNTQCDDVVYKTQVVTREDNA